MITRNNIESVLMMLTKKEINNAIDGEHDMIALTCGSYGQVYIENLPYSSKKDEEIAADGDLFCDKDTFIQILEESKIEY